MHLLNLIVLQLQVNIEKPYWTSVWLTELNRITELENQILNTPSSKGVSFPYTAERHHFLGVSFPYTANPCMLLQPNNAASRLDMTCQFRICLCTGLVIEMKRIGIGACQSTVSNLLHFFYL